MQTLTFFPGQRVVIFLETVDAQNVRTDGYALPVVDRIIFPGFTLASSYPQDMTKLDTGLYYYQFILPTGAISVGNYLIDVSYINPVNDVINKKLYQIVVNAPYGNFTAITS